MSCAGCCWWYVFFDDGQEDPPVYVCDSYLAKPAAAATGAKPAVEGDGADDSDKHGGQGDSGKGSGKDGGQGDNGKGSGKDGGQGDGEDDGDDDSDAAESSDNSDEDGSGGGDTDDFVLQNASFAGFWVRRAVGGRCAVRFERPSPAEAGLNQQLSFRVAHSPTVTACSVSAAACLGALLVRHRLPRVVRLSGACSRTPWLRDRSTGSEPKSQGREGITHSASSLQVDYVTEGLAWHKEHGQGQSYLDADLREMLQELHPWMAAPSPGDEGDDGGSGTDDDEEVEDDDDDGEAAMWEWLRLRL